MGTLGASRKLHRAVQRPLPTESLGASLGECAKMLDDSRLGATREHARATEADALRESNRECLVAREVER